MVRPLVRVLMCLALGGLVSLTGAAESQGAGLGVSPGALVVQHVDVGTVVDVSAASGMRLTIQNDTEREQTYVLSTHLPSDVGLRRWVHGYAEMPDLSWFWFDRYEVVVAPHGEGRVNMYFEIPKAERYYNQHWVFALGVSGKSGGTVQLAVYPRIRIETISKAGVGARPDGPLGLAPSVIFIGNLPVGTPRQATLRLYNNTTETRRYRLASKTFPAGAGQLSQIPPSRGYEWIPEPRWISPQKEQVRIGPQESVAVPLSITIPKDAGHRGKKWESILFIKSEDGRTRFARVQIETEK